MVGYELIPLDGGVRIPLPEGQTVLGRGPLLGVSDKRVSRQHGLLENQNGRLRLKPIHVNPCFSLQGGDPERPQPLERERWHQLGHGELFSLMPGRFIYRVEALGGEPLTPRAGGAQDGDDGGPMGMRDSPPQNATPPRGIGHEQTPPALTGRTPPPTHSPECDATPTQEAPPTRGTSPELQQEKAQTLSEQSGRGLQPKPKRVLPDWMTAGAAQEGQSGAGRKQAVPATNSTKRGRAELSRAVLSSDEAGPGLSSEEAKAVLSSEEVGAGLSSEEAKAVLSSEEVGAGLSSEEAKAGLSSEEAGAGLSSEKNHEDEDSSGSAPRRKRRRKMNCENTQTPKALPQPNHSNSPGEGEEECGRLSDEGSDVGPDRKSTGPGGAESGPAPSQNNRPRCPYGKDCYRKNPLHFQDCSHPGDHDYQQEEEEPEEEVERPECPYGIDCYRKNPLHRKEYNHSRRPARAARNAPRGHDDEDEDDDEDSFIDDSSDEAYSDPDYVPAGSDGSGQEDVQTLQDEAQDFLRSRK